MIINFHMAGRSKIEHFNSSESGKEIHRPVSLVPEHSGTLMGGFNTNILDNRNVNIKLSRDGVDKMIREIKKESEEEAKEEGGEIGAEATNLSAGEIKGKSSEAIGRQQEELAMCVALQDFFDELSKRNEIFAGTTGICELTEGGEEYVDKYFPTVFKQENAPLDGKSENPVGQEEKGKFCFVIKKDDWVEQKLRGIINDSEGENFQIIESTDFYMSLNLNGVKVLLAYPTSEVKKYQAQEIGQNVKALNVDAANDNAIMRETAA